MFDANGKPQKDEGGKNIYDYPKRNSEEVKTETENKKTTLESNAEKNINYFIAPNWTLEYSIFKSKSLSDSFQKVVKAMHQGTDWITDFEKSLAEKLINKGFKKTEIAYQLAQTIEDDIKAVKEKKKENSEINIDAKDNEDSINYLIKAIKHAAGN